MNPSISWQQVHDKFYRKEKIYTMNWGNIDLSKYLVAASPFGGPIALIRNDKRLVAINGQNIKQMLQIYTSSGRLLHQFQWDKGSIVAMGWAKNEQLICALEQGSIVILDLFGSSIQISLGEDAKEFGIIDAVVFNDGVVALTNNFQFIAITSLHEPRPRNLANIGLLEKPDCWDILPPDQNIGRHLEVYVATKKTVFVVDQIRAQDQLLQKGPFHKMAISPNGKLLALYTFDGRLWVVSTDFQVSLADFKTNSDSPPLQMAWCGNDSVLLHWDDIILLVGPSGDYLKFSYEGVVQLVSEIDCARIISSEKCEVINRVPKANVDIFRIGSTSPSAILYDAREQYDEKSPKADENIRSIRLYLSQAVDACIEAAGNEFEVNLQKSILKAASFGKAFLDYYPSARLVDMNRSLRILNAIRHPDVGIPLTISQYQELTAEGLVSTLINRRLFSIAKSVCDYLEIPSDRVLISWACYKVKSSIEDEESVSRIIFDKLSERKNISYAEVAKEAYRSGRTKLATKLLEFESCAADQVPLLLSMQQDDLALKKAIESGDTDLVYLTLFHMKRKLQSAEFFRIINDKPLACALLEIYAKQQDPQLLRDFYYQDDRRVSSANLIFISNYKQTNVEARISELKAAWKIYGESKTTSNEAKVTEETIKLLHLQQQLENEINHPFVDLSLNDTILKCFTLQHPNKASKLKSEFKVADKK
ncbi:hypothetical protein HK103_002839 [Boothiomyces macroporosus]|uniref:Vacuolar protein sorting-associated protein 16 homolog n=1 Tax=Boothiomyces macroporosus TaxID=261099 RepID=A0AAD5UJ28_9FUNG|nr:hypothetical protein HK103_002839 [Boothiomyces macroporosus]